jgi:hypothetical protein
VGVAPSVPEGGNTFGLLLGGLLALGFFGWTKTTLNSERRLCHTHQ